MARVRPLPPPLDTGRGGADRADATPRHDDGHDVGSTVTQCGGGTSNARPGDPGVVEQEDLSILGRLCVDLERVTSRGEVVG